MATESTRKHYNEKLTFSEGAESLPDPYALLHGWSESPSDWPDITFGDIYVYLVHTPGNFTSEELKAYKSLDAYEYVVSGQVQTVYMHNVDNGSPYCFLKAKVMPSHRVSGALHPPWCAHCTCMAGLGETCSHIAAVLFKVEMGVKLGLSSESSTSEACKWNKTFREEVRPFDHYKYG
eukprot:gene4077-20257_t